VICGISHGHILVNNHYRSNCEVLVVHFIEYNLGFSCLSVIEVCFQFKYIYLDQISGVMIFRCVVG